MLTDSQIQFLNLVCPDRWTETNGVISVNGGVDMDDMNLTKIPVQFGQVTGYFSCYKNQLTSLEGVPFWVGDYFTCQKNCLTSLEGGPKEIGSSYSCSMNILTNLIGAPEICNGTFWCRTNQLTSLKGCPNVLKKGLNCQNNPPLKYLWGVGRVHRNIWYDNENEINEWIIKCMKRDVIFPYATLEENINWIKHEQKYSILLDAPEEICQYFSPYIKNILLDVC